MAKTNPNGANQFTPDPREQLCWDYYLETVLEGRPNARQSAIKAGYKEASAKAITVTSWFMARAAKLRKKEMVSKGEKVLVKTLDYDTEKDGEINTPLLRIQTDVAKYVTSTLGKDDGYSTKEEHDLILSGEVEILSKRGQEMLEQIEKHEKVITPKLVKSLKPSPKKRTGSVDKEESKAKE